jgi:hypothetical protein
MDEEGGGREMTGSSGSRRQRIDHDRGRVVLEETMRAFSGGGKVDPDLWKDFVQVHNQGYTSGLEVGEQAPRIELPDQSGRDRRLADLTGGDGLLLVFVRSADW